MDDYRRREPSTTDLETVALLELSHRIKRLRSRVLFPVAAAGLIAGHCGIAAHALGYWSIFGATEDGAYFLAAPTIAVAFLIGALPFGLVGLVLHRVLGGRLKRAWCDEFEKKYKLPRDVLERNAGRYG